MSLTIPNGGTFSGRAPRASVVEAPEIGAAIAEIGDGVLRLGQEQLNRQRQRLQVDLERDMNDLRLEMEDMNDPEAISMLWPQRIADMEESYRVGDPEAGRAPLPVALVRDLDVMIDTLDNRHSFAIGRRNVPLARVGQQEAWSGFRDYTLATPTVSDLAVRAGFVDTAEDQLATLVKSGVMDQPAAETQFLEYRREITRTAAKGLVAEDPARFLAEADAGQFSALPEMAEADYRLRAMVANAVAVTPIARDFAASIGASSPALANQVERVGKGLLRQRNLARRGAQDIARRNLGTADTLPGPDVPTVPPGDGLTARAYQVTARAGELVENAGMGPLDAIVTEFQHQTDDIQIGPDAPAIERAMIGLDRIRASAVDGALIDDLEFVFEGDYAPPEEDRRRTGTSAARGWLLRAHRFQRRIATEKIDDLKHLEMIEAEARELIAEGASSADSENVAGLGEADALRRAGDVINARYAGNAVKAARRLGVEIPDLPKDMTELPAALADRAGIMRATRADLGLPGQEVLTAGDAAQLAVIYDGVDVSEQVGFLESVADMPFEDLAALAGDVRQSRPDVAAALLIAAVDPAAAARIEGGNLSHVSGPARARLVVLGGENAGHMVDALASIGQGAEAATVALPSDIRALQVRLVDLSPDEQRTEIRAADLSPDAARALDAPLDERFPMPDPEPADGISARIAGDAQLAQLAFAAGYAPMTDAAVSEFDDLIGQMERLPVEHRPDFVRQTREARMAVRRATLARPARIGAGPITLEGLRAAAQSLLNVRRGGRITDAAYHAEIALLRQMVETFDGG